MTYVSVVIPVYNNKNLLLKCLDFLIESSYENFEIIVVDDASWDNIINTDLYEDINYFRLDKQSGPAAARNIGATKAKGKILMFLDSDILVKPDTISRIVSRFDANPEISAIFGSYDYEPYAQDYLSQYKNLLHHFVHQNSNADANTFWAGCGAIRRSVFKDVGGFDEKKYKNPSIEDIELGYRLKEKGYKMFLDKDIQVKHLKSWNFLNWIKVEILNRAIPWSKLIIETGVFPFDLNLRISDRISGAISWIIVLNIIHILFELLKGKALLFSLSTSIFIFIVSIILFLFLNKDFYAFLLKKREIKFSILVTPFHILYYLYSSACFLLILIKHMIFKKVKK